MCCWLWRQFPLSSCISWAYVCLLPHGRWHSKVVKAVIVLKLVLCPTGLLMETGWILGEGLGLHSYTRPIEELRCFAQVRSLQYGVFSVFSVISFIWDSLWCSTSMDYFSALRLWTISLDYTWIISVDY